MSIVEKIKGFVAVMVAYVVTVFSDIFCVNEEPGFRGKIKSSLSKQVKTIKSSIKDDESTWRLVELINPIYYEDFIQNLNKEEKKEFLYLLSKNQDFQKRLFEQINDEILSSLILSQENDYEMIESVLNLPENDFKRIINSMNVVDLCERLYCNLLKEQRKKIIAVYTDQNLKNFVSYILNKPGDFLDSFCGLSDCNLILKNRMLNVFLLLDNEDLVSILQKLSKTWFNDLLGKLIKKNNVRAQGIIAIISKSSDNLADFLLKCNGRNFSQVMKIMDGIDFEKIPDSKRVEVFKKCDQYSILFKKEFSVKDCLKLYRSAEKKDSKEFICFKVLFEALESKQIKELYDSLNRVERLDFLESCLDEKGKYRKDLNLDLKSKLNCLFEDLKEAPIVERVFLKHLSLQAA